MPCTACWLGLVEYSKAWELQKFLLERRASGNITDTILLLEHTPTITIGKSGKLDNLLVPQETLQSKGVSFFKSDRGGDVTFHGPGQLVCYPIFGLREENKTVHQHIYELEEMVIRTLKDFAIFGERDEQHAGVWVSGSEIAALGLSIKKGISMHGFALNVNNDPDYFSMINPCGFTDRKATSVSTLLAYPVSVLDILHKLSPHISLILDTKLEWIPATTFQAFL